MPILQIRDIPDDVYQSLAAAARAEQRSLSQQAIVELRQTLKLGSLDRVSTTVAQLQVSGRRLPATASSPEALLREERDGR